MQNNSANFFGFSPTYAIGVVEDRMDPKQLGRVRVRLQAHHIQDKNYIPTQDLTWAKVLMPISAGQITGIGQSPTGLLPGSWVLCMALDCEHLQEWLVLGTFTGIPEEPTQKPLGFYDPRNDPNLVETLETAPRKIQDRQYNYDGTGIELTPEDKAQNYPREVNPLDNILNEPDTNRIALNNPETIQDTIVGLKKDTLDKNVPLSFDGDWSEQETTYNATYPFNQVKESESGHIQETDDTPNYERTHFWDRSGNFTEIQADGTKIIKVTFDSYEIVMRDEYIHICGNKNETVGSTGKKDYNLYITKDWNIQVDGNVNLLVNGSVFEEVKGDLHSTVDGNIHIKTGEDETHINGGNTTYNTTGKFSVTASEVDIKASGNVNIDGTQIWIASGKAVPDQAPTPVEPKVAS